MTTYTPTDIHYDYAIGGLPFLSAAGTKLSPYSTADLTRRTAPYRKEQTDQSTEVGEQSLQFWWTRSQSSFHGGAGQNFLDGGDTDPYRKVRFDYSRGVDVWTEGEVKLLHAMVPAATTESIWAVVPSSIDGVFYTGNDITHVSSAGVKTNLTGHTGTVQGPLTSDGETIYYTTTDGVWSHSALGPSGASAQMYGATASNLQHIVFAKERLFGLYNNSLYELSLAALGATALPAATYSLANTSAVMKSLTEAPDGVYIAVKTRRRADLYFMSLTDVGGVPTLGAAIQVLQLPDGEAWWDSPWCLSSYLGKFLLIASGQGIRIAKISAGGVVDAGPLMIEQHPDGDFVFGGFTTDDRFVYASCKGVSPSQNGDYFGEVCAFRIDLSLEIADGRYAWAQDQATEDTELFGTTCCFGPDGDLYIAGDSSSTTGLYKTDSTWAQDAYLMTSRIRYSTGEDKVFERLQITGEGVTGTIDAVPTLNADAATSYPTATLAGSTTVKAESRIEDAFAGKKTTFIQLKISFSPTGTDFQQGQMVFRGYVLKALPAQKRQRVERIPLLCFDLEKDQNQQTRGELGTAYTRLKALEALEEAGGVVTLQRFGPGFTSADDQSVVIDDIEFVQSAAPNKTNGWGGVILLTVRTVD